MYNSDAEYYGGEVEIFANPIGNLDLIFGIAYIDPAVKDVEQFLTRAKLTLKTMFVCYIITNSIAGWGSSAARRAHIPKVAGSNPAPATRYPVCHDFRGMRIHVSDVLNLRYD